MKYREFNEMKCYEIIDLINESKSASTIKSMWNNILKKTRSLPESAKKRVIKYFIISSITIIPLYQLANFATSGELSNLFGDCFTEVLTDKYGFQDPTQMRLSQSGREMIKDHEKLSLKAYSLGDGMITIGWGHAEPLSKSKYSVGEEISKDEANGILSKDLSIAADGIRKIFDRWKKEGNEVHVTQDMFDALVSLSFNCGVSGLRNSKMIQELKKKNYEVCGEMIKSFKLKHKFKGLITRRDIESKLFLSYVEKM